MTNGSDNLAASDQHGFWHSADRGLSWVSFVLTAAGSIAIVGFMVLIVADVLLRKFFSMPLNGVSEFVAYAIVACIFCQLGATIRQGRMINADFLMGTWEETRPLLAEGAKMIFYLIGFLLMIRIVIWLGEDALTSYERGEYSGAVGAFQLSLWPFKLVTAIGAFVATIETGRVAVLNGARMLHELRGPDRVANGLLGFLLLCLAVVVFALVLVYGDLSPVQLGILAFIGLFTSVALGMPVAFALIVMSFFAIWALRFNLNIADNALGIAASSTVRSFEFGVVPLFVMMGLILDRADVGRDAFRVAVVLLHRVRGGLPNATVAANAVFAAITGSSIASAAVFSRIAVPPMVESGYTRRFAVGVVAGSSVLGMLIPPSLLLIIYGLVAETSIGALFLAAVVPGLGLALCFGLLNTFLVTATPGFTGRPQPTAEAESMTGREMLQSLAPIAFLIFLVMGGIYGGFFSPTEAGAIGAAGAYLIAALRRRLNWETVKGVVLETGYITAGILFLIIAASLYSRMLALSSIPNEMTQFISSMNLSLIGFCLAYILLVMMLGMILDSVSILLIVVPIAIPVVTAFGGNPVWFGVLTIIAVEIGLLTPPFGLSVFVVKGSLPEKFATLGEIFTGVGPYVITMLLFTVLLVFVPEIALVLF
ncbi:TRAP transporter large permease subunit [Histidinibacterium aquaticum]|uniref:TRAP transporter large permease subunit n=1 Tax=Histidinibacterium aquaticum TaxID=2613962 RepID=A0A5J5GD79_9RHOB|nr:TRAP transporter large permease subunit [Histidinibacterium aquaticum]KAA9005732.1 TRAP transporter large permease subunit [Histidinibacterium aquaticum]